MENSRRQQVEAEVDALRGLRSRPREKTRQISPHVFEHFVETLQSGPQAAETIGMDNLSPHLAIAPSAQGAYRYITNSLAELADGLLIAVNTAQENELVTMTSRDQGCGRVEHVLLGSSPLSAECHFGLGMVAQLAARVSDSLPIPVCGEETLPHLQPLTAPFVIAAGGKGDSSGAIKLAQENVC
jgi:hypothetical protein